MSLCYVEYLKYCNMKWSWLGYANEADSASWWKSSVLELFLWVVKEKLVNATTLTNIHNENQLEHIPTEEKQNKKKKKSVPFSGCFLHLQESEFSECQYSHSSHHLQSYTFSTAPLSLLWNGKGIFSLQMAEKALALKGRNRWFYIYAHWAIKNIRHSWESSVCPDYFSDFIICLKYSRTKVL